MRKTRDCVPLFLSDTYDRNSVKARTKYSALRVCFSCSERRRADGTAGTQEDTVLVCVYTLRMSNSRK